MRMQMQPEDPVQCCEVQMPKLNISTPTLQVDERWLTPKLMSKQTVVLLDCRQLLTATHELKQCAALLLD